MCHGESSKSFDFECCLLNAAWLLLSLPPQLSQLGRWGELVLSFQLSLLQGLRAAKSWSTTAGPAHTWWHDFLFSPSPWHPHSGGKWLPGSFPFSSQCFLCLLSFMKLIYIVPEKEKSSPDSWMLSSRHWSCRKLGWYSQLRSALSVTTVWQNSIRQDHAVPGMESALRPLHDYDRVKQNKNTV